MKKFKNTLFSLLLIASSVVISAEKPILISQIQPTEFVTDQYNPQPGTSLYISGTGFFPKAQYQDARGGTNDIRNSVQVMYRQVYPQLGSYQVAPFGVVGNSRGNTYISIVGPNYIRLEIWSLLSLANSNTAWSFSVCAATVGCSNAETVYIRGKNTPSISIATGSNAIDIATQTSPRAIMVDVRGLTTNVPLLKVGSTQIYGAFDGRTTRFVLPQNLISAPNFLTAFVDDPITGSDSETFPIRVFGAPAPILSGNLAITQNLNSNQPIADAQIVVSMASMTSPTSAVWNDGSLNTNLLVPLDLLTNQARITIPAAALRLGKYVGNLRLINIAGEKIVPVNVEISKTVITPIPNPNPIPRPIPRPRP